MAEKEHLCVPASSAFLEFFRWCKHSFKQTHKTIPLSDKLIFIQWNIDKVNNDGMEVALRLITYILNICK